LEQNSTCFGYFLCPSSGVFHRTNSNGICHTGLLTACEQDQDGRPDPARCPKHVEFYSKNKFEKLVHLVGFIIRKNIHNRKCKIIIKQGVYLGFELTVFLKMSAHGTP